MNPKREKFEKDWFDFINIIEPSGFNKNIYVGMFKAMSDEDFHNWVIAIRDKKTKLKIYCPNNLVTLNMHNILKACDSVGIDVEERIEIWDPISERYYMPTHKYPIFRLPCRRLQQHLEHKRSIPADDTTVDLFTGQVRKPDKGSAISAVEMSTILSRGLIKSIQELVGGRGGNVEGWSALKGMLIDNGSASTTDIDPTSRARSAPVAKTLLHAAMIDNNL